MTDRATQSTAAIGGSVAIASALSPRLFLRPFGIAADEVTGAAAFGWRLFAVRTAYLSASALRGDAAARDAFLPMQVLDQAVSWHAFKTRSVPRRAPSSPWTFVAARAIDVHLRTVERAGQQSVVLLPRAGHPSVTLLP